MLTLDICLEDFQKDFIRFLLWEIAWILAFYLFHGGHFTGTVFDMFQNRFSTSRCSIKSI